MKILNEENVYFKYTSLYVIYEKGNSKKAEAILIDEDTRDNKGISVENVFTHFIYLNLLGKKYYKERYFGAGSQELSDNHIFLKNFSNEDLDINKRDDKKLYYSLRPFVDYSFDQFKALISETVGKYEIKKYNLSVVNLSKGEIVDGENGNKEALMDQINHMIYTSSNIHTLQPKNIAFDNEEDSSESIMPNDYYRVFIANKDECELKIIDNINCMNKAYINPNELYADIQKDYSIFQKYQRYINDMNFVVVKIHPTRFSVYESNISKVLTRKVQKDLKKLRQEIRTAENRVAEKKAARKNSNVVDSNQKDIKPITSKYYKYCDADDDFDLNYDEKKEKIRGIVIFACLCMIFLIIMYFLVI